MTERMDNPILEQVLQLPASAGRVTAMCSWRDTILLSTEDGRVWQMSQDFYTANFRLSDKPQL